MSLSGPFSSHASVPLHLSQLERVRADAQHRRDRSHFSIPDVTVTSPHDDEEGADEVHFEHKVSPAKRRSAIPTRAGAGAAAAAGAAAPATGTGAAAGSAAPPYNFDVAVLSCTTADGTAYELIEGDFFDDQDMLSVVRTPGAFAF